MDCVLEGCGVDGSLIEDVEGVFVDVGVLEVEDLVPGAVAEDCRTFVF